MQHAFKAKALRSNFIKNNYTIPEWHITLLAFGEELIYDHISMQHTYMYIGIAACFERENVSQEIDKATDSTKRILRADKTRCASVKIFKHVKPLSVYIPAYWVIRDVLSNHVAIWAPRIF